MQKKIFLTAIILVLSSSFWLRAQTNPPTPGPTTPSLPVGSWYATFNIFVFDADTKGRTPVEGALVTMQDQIKASAYTDSSGRCSLELLLHDTSGTSYTIEADGYETLRGGTYSLEFPTYNPEFGLRAAGLPYYELRFEPGQIVAGTDDAFSLDLYLTTTFFGLLSFEFELGFDSLLIVPDPLNGINGIEPLFSGNCLVDLYGSGTVAIRSTDLQGGLDPGVDIPLFTFHFLSLDNTGISNVNLDLLDINGTSFYPMPDLEPPLPVSVTVDNGEPLLIGDADGSGVVDIVDALMIARSYVGLDLSGTTYNILAADVNNDGAADIVDALIVAQYYVGLVPALPVA